MNIGIWKRRDANNNFEWFYGIGDFARTYATEDEARAAFAVLVEETNKYPSQDPYRAYKRLLAAKHPLFVKAAMRCDCLESTHIAPHTKASHPEHDCTLHEAR